MTSRLPRGENPTADGNRLLARVLLGLSLLVATSCSATASSDSRCDEAFSSAAEVSDLQDTHADMWPAFVACGSLEEFESSSSRVPDALDGADPALYVENQCRYEPTLEGSTLCDASGF